jgi:hypothetical protein
LRLWAQTGSRIFRPICLAFLADAYAADDKPDLAHRTFEEALRAKPASDGPSLKSIASSVTSSPAVDRLLRRSPVTSRRLPSPVGRDRDRSNCARQRASHVSCPIARVRKANLR